VLQVRLGVGGGIGRAAMDDVNPRAYEQYLRGLSLWGGRENDDNRQNAITAFRLATNYDPGFADAFAAYGVSITNSSRVDHGLDYADARRTAFDAFNRALEIDPDNARAHSGLGWYYLDSQPDIDRSLVHVERALELAPNAAFAHYAHANALGWSGDYNAATHAFEQAISLDPLNSTVIRIMAAWIAEQGDVEATERALENCSACSPAQVQGILLSAAVQSSPETAVRRQIAAFTEAYANTEGQGTTEEIAETVSQVEVMGNCFLGDLDACNSTLPFFNDRFARGDYDLAFAHALGMSGDGETAIDVLFTIHETPEMGNFTSVLVPGRTELPASLRRHPRYHEFWELPGMPELEAIRRSNGQTAGLPLPIEDSE